MAADEENHITYKTSSADSSVPSLKNKMPADASKQKQQLSKLPTKKSNESTKIALWNLNDGFDHILMVTIMAKGDISLIAI